MRTDKEPVVETLEEIAKRLPKELYNIVCFSCPDAFCKHWQEDASDVILSALRDRDERAVRIIDEHQALDKCEDNCWTTIKAAIREGEVTCNE